jgi:tetratricopeptide (TPR) repeat protein
MRNFTIPLFIGIFFAFTAQAQNKKQLDSLYNIIGNFKKLETPDNQHIKRFMDVCSVLTVYHLNYQRADSIFYYAKMGKTWAEKVGSLDTQAGFLFYMAIGYQVSNQPEEAIKYYQNSLQFLQKIDIEKAEKSIAEQTQKMISQIYNNLSIIYQDQPDFSKALEYQILSLAIKEKMNNQAGIANSYNTLGNIYELKGDYALSLENHLKALKIREEINDQKGMSTSYLNIGNVYNLLSNFQKAIEYYKKSLHIDNQLNNLRGKAFCLNNLGTCYKKMDQLDEAIKYYTQSLEINEKLKNLPAQADNLSNLGVIYTSKKEYTKSAEYLQKALQIREKLNSPDYLCISLINLGDLNYQQKNFDEAIELANKAYHLAKSKGFKFHIQKSLEILSKSYYQKNNGLKAYDLLNEFTHYSDSLLNETKTRQIAELQTKYETEKKEKEIELLNKQQKINQLALSEQTALAEKKQIALSLLSKEKELQTIEFEKINLAQEAELNQITQAKKIQAIEFDKKEKERLSNINLLKKENTIKSQVIENQKLRNRNFILFTGVGILLIGGVVGYLFLRQRQRLYLETERRLRENIIHQFDTLKNQISPHFLLNSLTALQSLIAKNPEKAQNFTAEMANVYRYVLELKDNLLVQLKEEIELSQAYISLQKMRFGENLQISLSVSEHKMDNNVPPLSLQLLLENAIKHNDLDENHPLKIDITDDEEYLIVKNNLQQKSPQELEKSTQIGLKNLKERYRLAGAKEPEFLIYNQEYIAKLPLVS